MAAARPRSTRRRERLALADGESLSFSKLVLATGSQPIRPRSPAWRCPASSRFRDISDIWTIWHRAAPATASSVIGGGLLGLEAAYGLAKAGARVTVLH
jgi:nitrite reductase (NADH) large subunit